MNKTIFIGRLTKDPEMRCTPNQTAVCMFTIAVERRYKASDGKRQSDFIPCVGWRRTAEFITKYFHKGNKISIVGSLQSRSYEDKDGKRHNILEVVVDEVGFVEKASEIQQSAPPDIKPDAGSSGFFPGDDEDTSVPFDI